MLRWTGQTLENYFQKGGQKDKDRAQDRKGNSRRLVQKEKMTKMMRMILARKK